VLDLRQGAVVVVRSQLAVAPVGAPVKGDAQEIFAFFDALAAEVANSPTRTYALLLVRPTSLETFVQARKAFQKWRAPYVHEPFDELWQPGAIAVRGALE
jgi:hypothetical protein